MITEDYVSFEVAKLLKEKGYKGLFNGYYNNAGCVVDKPNTLLKEPEYQYYERVSLYMVMKWLRIEHNIHIEILMTNHSMSERFDIPKYYWVAVNAKTCKWISESTVYSAKQFDTNEEACEAAIKYCLENLMNK